MAAIAAAARAAAAAAEAGNGIRTVEDVMAQLTENGTELDFSYWYMGDEVALVVATALPQCTALQTLGLGANRFGAEGARALAAALPQCTALQTLDLYNNTIGAEGVRALAAALPQCTALQALNLDINSIGVEGARALAAVLPRCTALQTLCLQSNSVGVEGARALAAALPQCRALQSLNLGFNRIGVKGVRVLAAALPQCVALQTLNLEYNDIGVEGARALAAVLPLCTSLQTLDLNWNSICAEGARTLAAALPQCTALQALQLESNRIGVDGARALAAALPQCTALQTLNLGDNSIGAEGASALAAALPQCTALQTLNLKFNRIGVEGARSLAAALPQCTALQTLDLSGNGVDATLLAEIEALLSQNQDRRRQAATTEIAASKSMPAVVPAPVDAQSSLPAFLVKRREDDAYAPAREALAARWAPTVIDLFTCPACMRRIAPGQSVLLAKCLHSICRDCAPHMLQADRTIKCAHCHVVSAVPLSALPPHPLIETKLASSDARDCAMCLALPEDERLAATVVCTSCAPEKPLCEAHATHHRLNMKTATHTLAALPHGGAPIRCATHDQPITAFCTRCCALMCLACTLSTHPAATHTATLLTEAAFVEAARARLIHGVAAVRAAAASMLNDAADATVAVKEVDERDATFKVEIERTIDVLRALLERRREAVHGRLLERSREERTSLQTRREEAEHRWRLMTSAADLAEQLATGAGLGVNAAAVMVQLEAAAAARLNAMLDLVPATPVPPPATLRLQFDEAIGEKLATLGEIVAVAPDDVPTGAPRKRVRVDEPFAAGSASGHGN